MTQSWIYQVTTNDLSKNWQKAWMGGHHRPLEITGPRLQAQLWTLTQACICDARKTCCQGRVWGDSAFQEVFQGSVLFTFSLNMPKFLIYPAVPQAQKPGFIIPVSWSFSPRHQELISWKPDCSFYSERKHHHMQVESTHWHNQYIPSTWATQLDVAWHTLKVAGWARYQCKRN